LGVDKTASVVHNDKCKETQGISAGSAYFNRSIFMAPLPYNNTSVYILTYFNGFRNHQLSVRFDSLQITPQQVADNVGEFMRIVDAGLPGNAGYVNARILTEGLSFTLPAPLPAMSMSGQVSVPDVSRQALQITIPGRSQQGRRNTVSIIGMHIEPPTSWVATGAANVTIGAMIDFLQGNSSPGAAPGAWLAIDGTDTIWYNRATFDYNDYWVRQLRR
jgi:hypothetical protein